VWRDGLNTFALGAGVHRDMTGQQDGQPFPGGTFKVGLGPGRHDISVIFKPTQSTIVFSITRPDELAPEYRVQHTRAGGFRRFSETEVVEAARKLALPFAEKASR
jgi:hypothetical protein